MDDSRTVLALILQTFVALNPSVGVVRGLTFFPNQLDAIDASLGQIQISHVIFESAEETGPTGSIRPGSVDKRRDKLLHILSL